MTWRLLARKDFADARRLYHLHTVVLVLVILLAGAVHVSTQPPGGTDPGSVSLPLAMLSWFIVPVLAVAFVQGVIVGMRSRGDLKLLMGMPFSRRDVVLGSFLGRSAMVAVSLLAGFAVAVLVALVKGAPMDPAAILVTLGAATLLGTAFVAIAIAISASVSTETRSSALAIGAFFLFVFEIWGQLPAVVQYVLNGFRWATSTPEWARLFANLSPVAAYRNVVASALPEVGGMIGQVPSQLPFYRTPAFALLVLGLWVVVPLVLGYRRFDGTDL